MSEQTEQEPIDAITRIVEVRGIDDDKKELILAQLNDAQRHAIEARKEAVAAHKAAMRSDRDAIAAEARLRDLLQQFGISVEFVDADEGGMVE